jgi:hypothetical protein
MAAAELWDYFDSSGVVADYTATELTLSPKRVVPYMAGYNQNIHYGDGSTDICIKLATEPQATVTLQFDPLTASSAGTLLDFYMDTSKADGMGNTFYWSSPDGHSYTARFIA